MLAKDIRESIIKIVGAERFMDDNETIAAYSYDGFVEESAPDAVVFPLTTGEVSEIMKIAFENKIPVVPRGGGSNLSGGTVAVEGGLILNLTKMNKIKELNFGDRFAVVEPGVINANLQKALAEQNYFFPPDPSSMGFSTIGGNIAENAGGPRCLKYGVTADYILGLEAVLSDGRVIRTGSCNVKDVTGLRLSSLFCGSEGSLGIVTEATLRIVAQPEAYKTILAYYDDLDNTAETVKAVMATGIVPAAMELMDKVTMNLVEDSAKLGLPRDVEGMLIIEVDGVAEGVVKQADRIIEIARGCGAKEIKVAKDEQEREALWKARRAVHGILSKLAPNCITEDATVPVSNVPIMIKGVRKILLKYKITAGLVAHAGDGNMHPVIVTDIRDKEEWERVEKATEEIFKLAVELRGTLSGEHGIGLAKKAFLPLVIDENTRDLTALIKKTLDPAGILNPGKSV
ncbi:MAG: FAD-binding oxidoreductase [Deferribacterales bacterium]